MKLKDLLGCGNIANLAKHIILAKWSDTFGRAGLYWCEYDGISFFVKIAPYNNLEYDKRQPPPQGFMPSVDAEISALRAIKTRVIDVGHTPHVAEILAAFICPGVAKLIKDKEQCKRRTEGEEAIDDMPPSLLCLFQELIARGHSLDKVALVFMEECNMPLPVFMEHHLPVATIPRDRMLMAFAFQVYYTFLVLVRIWPGFAHGDMTNMANLMIKIMAESRGDSFNPRGVESQNSPNLVEVVVDKK